MGLLTALPADLCVESCVQYYNNTIGTLSVLAFDTSLDTYSNGEYQAAACKFDVGVIIVPSPQSQLSADQLFPLTDGAAPLPGSMLKVRIAEQEWVETMQILCVMQILIQSLLCLR